MIDDGQSVCIYHNGNSRILEYYKTKFSHLTFKGNWAESSKQPQQGCLWEICFADATTANMMSAINSGVFVLRHISSYRDDIDNILPECQKFDYQNWLNYVVSNRLCFADQVVSDIVIDNQLLEPHTIAVITTGRTANSHFQQIVKKQGYASFEANPEKNVISSKLLQSSSAVFLWRLDQWECLTSNWIGHQSKFAHQLVDSPTTTFTTIPCIDFNWIDNDWYNHCQSVLNHAMFFCYVCQRPITHTTTEYVVSNFESQHRKLKYDKSTLIESYQKSKQYYDQSDVAKNLDLLYNRVIKNFDSWKLI